MNTMPQTNSVSDTPAYMQTYQDYMSIEDNEQLLANNTPPGKESSYKYLESINDSLNSVLKEYYTPKEILSFFDLTRKDNKNNTVMIIAVTKNDVNFVRTVISNQVPYALEHKNNEQNSAIDLALQFHRTEIAILLTKDTLLKNTLQEPLIN